MIAGIILFVIAFKIAKMVFKTVMFALALALILISVMGFLVISDVKALKEDVIDSRSLVLVMEGEEYTKVLIHEPDDEDRFADEDQLERINSLEKEELVLSYSRLVILTPEEDGGGDGVDDSDAEEGGAGRDIAAKLGIGEFDEGLFKDPIAIIKAYKDNDIEIYPELRTSRAINLVPIDFIRDVYEKVDREIGDETDNVSSDVEVDA